MTTTTPTFLPLQSPPQSPPPQNLRPRAAITLTALAAGYTLAYTQLPLHLPETCPFKLLTGQPCAACGLTHAFCALANFHPLTALHFNLTVLPLALFTITATALLALELATNRPHFRPAMKKTGDLFFYSTLAILPLAWAVNLFHLWP